MATQPNSIPISQEVIHRIIETKKAKVQVWPCHVNRASNLGHPCERFCVLCRTAWDKRPLYDWRLQFIFDEGNRQEKAIEEDLRDAGFELVEQQRPYVLKDQNITGHIDGKILWNKDGGRLIPYEAKSMAPHIWMTVNSIQDMFNSRYSWVRKYPAQLTLYLLMDNKEYGLFILKNKSTGMLKAIDLYLDWEYAESLLKKAERINQHVKDGTLPETIKDASVCERCDFLHLCMPDMGGVEFTDGKIIELLDEREDLMGIVEKSEIPEHEKRIDEINKLMRTIFEERPSVIAGPYFITGKWCGSGERKWWKVDIACGRIKEKVNG